MRICFIGDDLFMNADQMRREALGYCGLDNSYRPQDCVDIIDKFSSEEVYDLLLEKKKIGNSVAMKHFNPEDEYSQGIYWATSHFEKIEKLNVDSRSIVFRRYEEAIKELGLNEFDFYVVDLNFLGSREVARDRIGSFVKSGQTKVMAAFGVLIAKILMDKKLPFIIFTTDTWHAREGLALLVKEGICPQQEVDDIAYQCEQIGERWKKEPRLLVSESGILAVGPKHHKKTWDLLLERIN